MVPVALAGQPAGRVVGPQAGLPDRLRRPAGPRAALLPERQPVLPRRRAAPRRHRRGDLRGRLGPGRRRPDEGDRPVQPHAGGARHGDRHRRRPEQPRGRLRRQGGRLRRRLPHPRGDRRRRARSSSPWPCPRPPETAGPSSRSPRPPCRGRRVACLRPRKHGVPRLDRPAETCLRGRKHATRQPPFVPRRVRSPAERSRGRGGAAGPSRISTVPGCALHRARDCR